MSWLAGLWKEALAGELVQLKRSVGWQRPLLAELS
jgi:hypothetical protein